MKVEQECAASSDAWHCVQASAAYDTLLRINYESALARTGYTILQRLFKSNANHSSTLEKFTFSVGSQ